MKLRVAGGKDTWGQGNAGGAQVGRLPKAGGTWGREARMLQGLFLVAPGPGWGAEVVSGGF